MMSAGKVKAPPVLYQRDVENRKILLGSRDQQRPANAEKRQTCQIACQCRTNAKVIVVVMLLLSYTELALILVIIGIKGL